MSERESMPYDVVIVGAGPAGLAAAIRLKQLAGAAGRELSVCVLEKGSEVGAHILSGAVIDPRALDELLPEWREQGCPLAATPVTENHHWTLSRTGKRAMPHGLLPPFMRNHGTYTGSLGNLCRWLAEQAEGLGVEIFPGFAAAEILFEGDKEVVRGVATGDMGVARDGSHKPDYQPGLELHAKYILFAEGARGHLTKELIRLFDLRADCQPQIYGIGIKELWDIAPDKHVPGRVIHTQGWPLSETQGSNGGGFLYHQAGGQVALGFVTWLSYTNPHLSPFHEMQRWKTHPAIREVLEGGKRVSYGARAISDGGWQSVPRLTFPGGALIGDCAGFLNVPRIKGTHTSMKSGMMAAEAAFEAIAAGREHDELAAYPEAYRHSWVEKELRKVRNVAPLVKKHGDGLGSWLAGITMWLEHLGIPMPFTMKHHPDHESLWRKDLVPKIDYPKPDGVISFDRLSSVFLSNTNHEEDQPCHLTLKDPNIPVDYDLPMYDEPAQRYCPAGVYEIVGEETGEPKFVINAQNCVHCKTCDIKDPTQNINWVVPKVVEAPITPICKRNALIGFLLLGLASPAWAAARPDDLAAYLKARAAEADGHVASAVTDYAAAMAADPGNQDIAIRAYRAALDAGDYNLADRALASLQQAGVAPPDSAIVSLADAIHAGDKRAASAAIDRMESSPLAFMLPVLKAWQAYDDGDKDPIAVLSDKNSASIGRRYEAENRALLLIATGKADDGIAAVRALLGPDQASFDFRVAAAQLLAGRGKQALAQSLLGGDDPVLGALRSTLGDGVKPSLAFGASRLFDRLASDLGHGEPSPLTIVLTRSALRIDPHDDRARLLLAQALEQEDATDLALAALDGIDMNGPFAEIARSARVAVLSDAGRDDQALAAAQALDAAPTATAEDAQRLGDAYVALDRYAEAAKAYDQAITRAGADADWSMYLQKGGALEQAGNWPEARAALQKAVEMAPDEPLALNYLGYAEIEHGEDLAAAQKMLEKASALKPGDPAITDSLGWAYFKLGNPAKALPLFERAVQGQPADVTINEHLGDAYWKTGRFYEARYAWRAAAVNAEGKDKDRLLAKIENGLGAGPVQN